MNGLPFCDGSFDLVILNGVLEWVGAYSDSKSPSQCQKDLLREISRVLRPGGSLYIGIENRFGYKFLLGKPDDHSQVMYTSLLPRFLADRRMIKIKGKPYRTYTYSYWGLKRLLGKCGFHNVKIALSLPDYRYFKHIIPLESPEAARFYHNRLDQAEAQQFLTEQRNPRYKLGKIFKRILLSAARLSLSALRDNLADLKDKSRKLPREILLGAYVKYHNGTRLLAVSFSAFAKKTDNA